MGGKLEKSKMSKNEWFLQKSRKVKNYPNKITVLKKNSKKNICWLCSVPKK